MTTAPLLRVHAILPRTEANGPGLRAALWLQGCDLDCPGCGNPAARPREGGDLMDAATVLARFRGGEGKVEGVSLSGGEPLLQIAGLLPLVRLIRRETDWSILLFSGRTIEKIEADPAGSALLRLMDVLVDGPYRREQRQEGRWPTSANQRIHLLTDRYTLADVVESPLHEITLAPDGTVVVTGVGGIALPL